MLDHTFRIRQLANRQLAPILGEKCWRSIANWRRLAPKIGESAPNWRQFGANLASVEIAKNSPIGAKLAPNWRQSAPIGGNDLNFHTTQEAVGRDAIFHATPYLSFQRTLVTQIEGRIHQMKRKPHIFGKLSCYNRCWYLQYSFSLSGGVDRMFIVCSQVSGEIFLILVTHSTPLTSDM